MTDIMNTKASGIYLRQTRATKIYMLHPTIKPLELVKGHLLPTTQKK